VPSASSTISAHGLVLSRKHCASRDMAAAVTQRRAPDVYWFCWSLRRTMHAIVEIGVLCKI
jgi:hypothetical protein